MTVEFSVENHFYSEFQSIALIPLKLPVLLFCDPIPFWFLTFYFVFWVFFFLGDDYYLLFMPGVLNFMAPYLGVRLFSFTLLCTQQVLVSCRLRSFNFWKCSCLFSYFLYFHYSFWNAYKSDIFYLSLLLLIFVFTLPSRKLS